MKGMKSLDSGHTENDMPQILRGPSDSKAISLFHPQSIIACARNLAERLAPFSLGGIWEGVI